MCYYAEKLSNGGCFICDVDKKNIFDAAQAIFDYLDEIHRPIMVFYDKYPHKACDKTSWERWEVDVNNIWKEARLAVFKARIELRESGEYFGPGEWE